MRLLGLLVIATAGVASAQSTDTVRLMPGEVPLRVVAAGKVRTLADGVILTIPVSVTAATATAATAAATAATARVTAALTQLGVPAAAIASGQPATALGFIGNESDDEDSPTAATVAAAAQARAMQPKRQNSLTMRVTLGDLMLLPRAQQALDRLDQPYSSAGTLKDEGAARRAAVADAAAHAAPRPTLMRRRSTCG